MGLTDTFRKIIESLGYDIALLLPTTIIGLFLAIIYNGTTPPNTQVSIFAIIFSLMSVIALGAAILNKLSEGKFFRGAEFAIVDSLSVKRYPILALAYVIVFSIIGFAIVEASGFMLPGFNKPSSVFAAPDFVFQNLFSPIVEEYFWRGLIQPILEIVFLFGVARYSWGGGMFAKGLAVLVSGVFQGVTFAFVHISAFSAEW